MTDTITLPRETVSQLTRLFTDMQLSRLPSLWQVSTLLNILTAALEQQAEPGGCQLHNLQCGYPACDKPVITPQQQAEPIGWLDGNDKLAEFMHRDLKAEHDKRGSATPRDFTVPVYAAPQQQAEPVNNRIYECAKRLVEYADFRLGGILSADSSAKDIPSNAVSHVKSRHLAALRNSLYTTAPQHPSIKEGT